MYKKSNSFFFFSIRVFFDGHLRLTGQQGKGGDHFLLHPTTSTRSRTFRHLFITLHVRWLSHIFNRNAYFVFTRLLLDEILPLYRITISITTLSNYQSNSFVSKFVAICQVFEITPSGCTLWSWKLACLITSTILFETPFIRFLSMCL